MNYNRFLRKSTSFSFPDQLVCIECKKITYGRFVALWRWVDSGMYPICKDCAMDKFPDSYDLWLKTRCPSMEFTISTHFNDI